MAKTAVAAQKDNTGIKRHSPFLFLAAVICGGFELLALAAGPSIAAKNRLETLARDIDATNCNLDLVYKEPVKFKWDDFWKVFVITETIHSLSATPMPPTEADAKKGITAELIIDGTFEYKRPVTVFYKSRVCTPADYKVGS